MKKGPFIHSKNSTRKMMQNLLIAFIPIILFSFYKNGVLPYQKGYVNLYGLLKPLIFPIVGMMMGIFVEYLTFKYVYKKNKEEVKKILKNSYAIFPGLFLSLILPINTPLWVFILGCVFATFLGKMIYGGFGHNIFNPALIGCLFVLTFYGSAISSIGGYLNAYELDTIASATPLTNAATVEGIGTYATLVAPYGTLMDFLIGFIPGSIGETSALLCIVAFFYLSYKHVIKWKIPLIYVGTVFLLTWIIGHMNGLGLWYPTFQVLSGGLLFGAVFMATDPVTSPITSIGQILYALFLGILTVVFRYLSPLPEGVLTSILTMNIFVIILDKIGASQCSNLKKGILPFLLCIGIGIISACSIAQTFKKTEEGMDPNFEIILQEEKNGSTVYQVTQKGNGGLITSELVVEDGEVKSFKVLNQHETPAYYAKIDEEKYLNLLLQNQKDLADVDTVAGATISSKALKKTLENVLKNVEVTK